MVRLIYHSKAADSYTAERLNLFLSTIRKKNICLNVTGILLYHRGNVMQIIEGEYDTISALFERIKIDTRHTDVMKIIDYPITNRFYKDWSMSFKELSEKEWVKIKGYLNLEDQQIGLSNYYDKSAYIKVLIDSFMHENEILSPKPAGLMRKIISVFS